MAFLIIANKEKEMLMIYVSYVDLSEPNGSLHQMIADDCTVIYDTYNHRFIKHTDTSITEKEINDFFDDAPEANWLYTDEDEEFVGLYEGDVCIPKASFLLSTSLVFDEDTQETLEELLEVEKTKVGRIPSVSLEIKNDTICLS